jgi:myo-inositol-1(or 4)-monophosphatase
LQASDDTLDRGALMELAATAAREAGGLALKSFNTAVRSWFKGKGTESPVSDADMAVDALLKERLATPGFAWLSEETEDDRARLTARHVWVVDPIDGTRAFLAGRADWTISVALVEHGRPVVAALYAPVTDELFAAVAGGGATHNGVPIAVVDGETLAGTRIAGPQRALEKLSTLAPGLVLEPKVHSLALRFARVAQGRIDAALAGGNSHDWDLAAADLLVHEAHGVMTTTAGETIMYNRPTPTHEALLAAGRSRHRALSDIIGRSGHSR